MEDNLIQRKAIAAALTFLTVTFVLYYGFKIEWLGAILVGFALAIIVYNYTGKNNVL